MKNKLFIIVAALVAFLGTFSFIYLYVKDSYATVNHSHYKEIVECIKCHPRDLPTHKKWKPESMKENWPLGSDGKMLCITCHDCARVSCVLRKNREELCQVCHDCTQGMACLIGVAHMGSADNLRELSVGGCLACHDGAVASNEIIDGDHPVNVLYIPSKRRGFKQIRNRRVVFVDGMVTCISCHDPYNTKEARLTVSIERSRLCLTCHNH